MATASNKIGPAGIEVSNTVLLAGGAVALLLVVGVAWYAKNKISDAADAAADAAKSAASYVRNDAVDITSKKNLATTAVNTLGGALGIFGTNDFTGKDNTLGEGLEEGARKVRGLFD